NPPADRRWLVEQHIRALLAEQRGDEALEFAEKQTNEIEETVLNELRLLALLQSKRFDDAVSYAEEWRTRAKDSQQVLRLLARSYREAGRIADMSRMLAELRRLAPADPRVRVFGVVQEYLAGNDKTADAQLDDYIFRFGGSVDNFILLAEPLAE